MFSLISINYREDSAYISFTVDTVNDPNESFKCTEVPTTQYFVNLNLYWAARILVLILSQSLLFLLPF